MIESVGIGLDLVLCNDVYGVGSYFVVFGDVFYEVVVE